MSMLSRVREHVVCQIFLMEVTLLLVVQKQNEGRLVSTSKKAGKMSTKGPTLAEFNCGIVAREIGDCFPQFRRLTRYLDTHSLKFIDVLLVCH